MGLVVKYSENKSVPEGVYDAKLTKLTSQTHSQYGENILWNFDIINGPHTGTSLTALSSTKVSPKSKIFSWVQAFGVRLVPGEEFDLESLIGKAVRVRVINKIQTKMVEGKAMELTFSNVDALAPLVAQNVSANTEETETATESKPESESESTVSNNTNAELDIDQDFNF